MNTKKILSLVLALVMVCSMMATLTVTSFAISSESYVGETMVFRITGQLGTDEEEGNVKSIAFVTGTNPHTGESYVEGEILSTEQVEEIIEVTVKAINAGDVSLSYQRYSGGSWENGQTRATTVYPTIAIGETITCTIPDRTLYPDNPDGNIKNITAVNATVVSAVQNGEDVDITLKATSVGTICVTFDEREEGALDFSSNDEMVVAKAVPADNYHDLEASTTDIPGSKELDQNYNLTVEEGDETNVTKVKLSWTISDINAVRTDNKVWDTTELKWVDVAGTPTVMDNGTATFKFENYSSVKVDAAAKFEALSDTGVTVAFDATTGTDGKITLDTANGSEIYSETNVPTGEITVTVTPSDDFFNDKTATTTAAKYGTYTVTISQAEEPVKLTFTRTTSYATLSYNGKTYNYGESFVITVPKNSVVSIVTTGSVGEEPTQSTLTVDGKTVTQYSETGYNLAWFPISNGAVITENTDIKTSSCILSGTAVTLADGSTKIIDDVTTEDKLMTFNFYEGKLDGNYPMYVMKHENVAADVITVTLDNGTVLEMCDWQQFFDMDQKTYFDIDVTHYQEAVGRNIMFVDNGAVTTARIVSATMETRVCTSYEIFTEYNKNFVANGILTVEPETYLQGVYTIGDDLKIDMEQYQKDVAAYGRYTYEEFAHIMTKDEFDKMNIADKKIAVGKGIVSEEWLFDLYRQWMPQYS